ncbi:hypothetical protein [Mycolicibacterium chlorophenolicum]|uniref:hypothetical protein n=1 Tax=Mycolicibacterium chlorophenolicum TaxID=37916 RepID=UPI0012E3E8F7|nr:hypothetical protein [Mycolicibacterium chlorophenolicum]
MEFRETDGTNQCGLDISGESPLIDELAEIPAHARPATATTDPCKRIRGQPVAVGTL